ncbi:MAG: ATP-binding protein [Solirubrobacteraceae bacterium]
MSGLVALLSPEGMTIELNRAALDLAGGVRRETVVGKPFWSLPHWAADGATAALLSAGVADAEAGTPTRVEAQLAAGGILLVELRPLVSGTGETMLVIAEGRDVTELHAVSERLRALDTRRRRFVQAVGHDLKSPLAVLLALAARAQARDDGPGRDDLDSIAATTRALNEQVDDLLNAARASERAVEPSLGEEDLAEIVREAVRGLSALARERDVRVDVRAEAAVAIRADRRRLASMAVNLVHNALRYAATGVEVELVADGPMARLTVTDDGPGVPERLREEVFERFNQGHDIHGVGAVGLGLSIVRDVVTLHGGSVRLGAGEHGGARFTVDLPRIVASSEQAPAAPVVIDGFEAVPTALGIVGPNGVWLQVNAALCELLGCAREDLLGQAAADALPAALRTGLPRMLAGEPRALEVDVRAAGRARGRVVRWRAVQAHTGPAVVVIAEERASRGQERRRQAPAQGGGQQLAGPPAGRPRQGGTRRVDGSGVGAKPTPQR